MNEKRSESDTKVTGENNHIPKGQDISSNGLLI